MSKQLIKDLKEGDFVSTFLQVEDSNLYSFKNKPGHYAVFSFSDRTGYIKGVCWERGETYHSTVSDGSIVQVDGRIVTFNKQLQINIDRIEANPQKEHDPDDFMAVSPLDPEELFGEIQEAIGRTENPHLKELLESFFGDEEFAEAFKKCPAAKSIHHSYLGGLMEHTRNCMRLAETLCELYPQLNRDMLVSGVLMHDMGKTVEMSFDTRVDYTDKGKLLGHIVIGQNMIRDKIDAMPDFPEELANEIAHLIISHHGENSTGSPKRPKTAEACALHFLENLDAQTKRFLQIIEDSSNHLKNSNWTIYNRLLERYLYRGPEPEDETQD
ncbi:3'-5' exoribonuclease YhaM family protein [bacterium]